MKKKLIRIKDVPKAQMGGKAPVKDYTGMGTYLYNEPLEMQLNGYNPIVGGPVDVMAQDQRGQTAFIPKGTQDPTMMYGKVTEIPFMKKGGKTPITMSKNKTIAPYNPHRDFSKSAHQDAIDEPSQKDIADNMKPIDQEDANIEAEKGELIMKPDMMGIHKVKGKTHGQGGTPLLVEEGSFIFSNDPDLSIDKQEVELFDFKTLKSKAASKNTPAKVLEREVKPKEYNSLVEKLKSDDSDKITRNTAALMLEKYQKKIGQVAFLQESKKSEPVPDFAMGTAPFVQQELDEAETEEKMYAQRGGSVPIYPGGRTKKGRYTPTGYDNQYDFPFGPPKESASKRLLDEWKQFDVNLSGKTPSQAQELMYDWALQNNPELLRNLWTEFGLTEKGKMEKLNTKDLSDSGLKGLKSAFVDNMLGVRTFSPEMPSPKPAKIPGPVDLTQRGQIPTPPYDKSQPPAPAETIGSLPYDIKGKLTPAQLGHLGYLGLQAMSVNKYYPKREQVDLPEVNLDTINAQPYLNQVDNQSFQAYKSLGTADPRAARVAAGQIYGKGLDAKSQILGNIDNQNTQIQNQENLTNLQQRTNQVMTNTQYDDRYFDQVQMVRENADKEKRYAGNQFMGQLNQYQSQADALAWGLAAQGKFGRRLITDPKTGKKYYKPTQLFEYGPQGIRYNADVADINLATGADRINSMEEAVNTLKQYGIAPTDYKSVQAMSNMIRAYGQAKNPLYSTNPLFPGQ